VSAKEKIWYAFQLHTMHHANPTGDIRYALETCSMHQCNDAQAPRALTDGAGGRHGYSHTLTARVQQGHNGA
jgi:hypothetical protein